MVNLSEKSNKANVSFILSTNKQITHGSNAHPFGEQARNPGPRPSAMSRVFTRLRPTTRRADTTPQREPPTYYRPGSTIKWYTITEAHRITYRPRFNERDASPIKREIERGIASLIDPHWFEINDWEELQRLLKTRKLDGQLTDEHLRNLIFARYQIYVVRPSFPEASKLLHRPAVGSDYMENGHLVFPSQEMDDALERRLVVANEGPSASQR